MAQIKIKMDVNVCEQGYNDRLIKSLINRNFKEMLEDSEAYEYPLSDPGYAGEALFEDLVSYMESDNDASLFYHGPADNRTATFSGFCKSAGVSPESLVNWVQGTLLASKVSKAVRNIFADGPDAKSPTGQKGVKADILARYEKKIKEFKAQGGEIVCMSCLEAEQALEAGEMDVWAVRSKYGDHDCLFYGVRKGTDRHIVRYEYAIDTCCNYYEARECEMKTWLGMSEEKKYATSSI